jgi:predicted RNA binding protein YcfA (HicA-like mRNA interferase family)
MARERKGFRAFSFFSRVSNEQRNLRRMLMSKIPGINHLRAVAALEKAGFRILRQGAHIIMTDGSRILTIPRHNPVNAFTMGDIVRTAGLSIEKFRGLL